MKTFRVIQNVLIAVGIITTVSLVDGIEVSASNVQAAFVIACFTIVTIPFGKGRRVKQVCKQGTSPYFGITQTHGFRLNLSWYYLMVLGQVFNGNR